MEGGAGFAQAVIDQPYMFDFYEGGGLDIASLSFAQVDREGNVNVHRFDDRLRGPGGFPNISAHTPRICYVGTFTTGGLEVTIEDGRLHIVKEGSVAKFVEEVAEISFSGRMARERGQQVKYITERAVFELIDGVVTLTEVAEGIDPEKDVLSHMGFEPAVASELRTMDPRIFSAGPMRLTF